MHRRNSYVNKTRAGRISNRVKVSPDQNRMPGISNQLASTNAALHLIEAITKPVPTYLFLFIRNKNYKQ